MLAGAGMVVVMPMVTQVGCETTPHELRAVTQMSPAVVPEVTMIFVEP